MAYLLGERLDKLIDPAFNSPTLAETHKAAPCDGVGNLAGHKVKEGWAEE
jgi:hypothetical protein